MSRIRPNHRSHSELAVVKSKDILKSFEEELIDDLSELNKEFERRVKRTKRELADIKAFGDDNIYSLFDSPSGRSNEHETIEETDLHENEFDVGYDKTDLLIDSDDKEEDTEENVEMDNKNALLVIKVFSDEMNKGTKNRSSLRFLRRLLNNEVRLLKAVRKELKRQGKSDKDILYSLAEEILSDGTRAVEGSTALSKEVSFEYDADFDVVDQEQEAALTTKGAFEVALVETVAVPLIAATMVDDPTFNADAVPTITAHSTSIIDPTIKSDVTIAVIPMEDAAESKKYQKQSSIWTTKNREGEEANVESPFGKKISSLAVVKSRVSTTYGDSSKSLQLSTRIWSNDAPIQGKSKRRREKVDVAPPPLPPPDDVAPQGKSKRRRERVDVAPPPLPPSSLPPPSSIPLPPSSLPPPPSLLLPSPPSSIPLPTLPSLPLPPPPVIRRRPASSKKNVPHVTFKLPSAAKSSLAVDFWEVKVSPETSSKRAV